MEPTEPTMVVTDRAAACIIGAGADASTNGNDTALLPHCA